MKTPSTTETLCVDRVDRVGSIFKPHTHTHTTVRTAVVVVVATSRRTGSVSNFKRAGPKNRAKRRQLGCQQNNEAGHSVII